MTTKPNYLQEDTVISNSEMTSGLLELFQDNKLLESRRIFLSEGVNARVAKRVIADLLILDGISSAPIELFLNSPGGEVNSGFAIFDVIRFLKAPVRIINAGLCASIATIINVAAKKENRFSLPNSRFLIHQPLIMGQVYGQASDLEITARQILMTREKINVLLAAECGQPLDRVAEDTKRDYWMSAKEAVEYGLITKIIENAKDIK